LTDLTEPKGLHGQRYERQSVLGSGGQGVVYRAFDHWTGQPVAIKVLKSDAGRQPHMVERLRREQQALSALEGTAAVHVLDMYLGSEGELCLVMELLQGTNLDAHLFALEASNERMPLERVAEIFDPIVDTLEVAHKAGIVHRDLKPANVFLLDDGGVRLLDFGMARLKKSAPLTADGTVMGSPSFMAPEAWKGQSSLVDHRADVYSLGVILFRVLAGDLPFSGLSLYEKFLGSTKSERPSLYKKRPDLPPDIDEWVVLALAIDPEQRFRNVRALWNALVSTLDLTPPNKRSPSFWAKAKGKAKELVGLSEASQSGESVPSKKEQSFISAALARSIINVEEPLRPLAEPPPVLGPASGEATVLLDGKTIELPRPQRADPEKPVEKTLELSSSNLVLEPTEDTLPLAPGASESPSKERNRKKRSRKARRAKKKRR
jgi:serine/threonine-protein kinase